MRRCSIREYSQTKKGLPGNEYWFFREFDGSSIDLLVSQCASLTYLEVVIIAVRLENNFPSFLKIFFGGYS